MLKKYICLFISIIEIVLFGTRADAAVSFNKLVDKYEFDVERYIKVNKSGPSIDYGSSFSMFKPYLKISSKKNIVYYFSFNGGKGKLFIER